MVASTIGLLVMLLVFDYFQTGASLLDESLKDPMVIIVVIIFGVPLNIIGDYLSLWETRKLLQLAARRPAMLPLLIPLDALLTITIWLACLALLAFGMQELGASAGMVEIFRDSVEAASQGLLDLSKKELKVEASILTGATLATSYITSIWLWLAVVASPLARMFLWSRTSGLSALGRFINTEQKPFTALGLLTALMIMFTGTLFWSLGFLVT